MSSDSDFKPVLLKDDRLNVSSSIQYAVVKGGQSIVGAVVNCPAPSTSQINFTVMVPNETTILSRKILWKTTFIATISGTAPVGSFLVNYGTSDSLAPYPGHQLITTMNCTINQATVSSNTQQILGAILRLGDRRKANRYNSGCPTAFDTLNNYADGIGASNNVLGAFANASIENDFYPRGAFVLDAISSTAPVNGVLSTITPQIVSTGAAQSVYLQFTTSEHLMQSPWLFSDVEDKSGIYGLRTLGFMFNLAPTGLNQRWFRSANNYTQSAMITNVVSSQLLLEYISPHSSDLLSPKNILPYYDLPVFKTPIASVPMAPLANSTQQVVANSLQLGSVPDKLIIYCRKLVSNQTCNDTDSFLTINSVNINWNNTAGLLSSYSQNQLFLMSVKNGYNGSWEEWSGKANFSDASTGFGRVVPTSGGVLIIELGTDLPLQEDWMASGLLGSFNIQVSLNVTNNSQNATPFTGELCVIPMSSGILVTSAGVSQVYTGLLNRQDILDASQQDAHFVSDAHRMIGSGFWDSAKSLLGKIAPHAKKYLLGHDNKTANVAGQVLGALGYGKGKHSLQDRLQ